MPAQKPSECALRAPRVERVVPGALSWTLSFVEWEPLPPYAFPRHLAAKTCSAPPRLLVSARMSRKLLLALCVVVAAQIPSFARIGGPKTIPLDPSGNAPGELVAAQMGMGGALKGATKVVVPVIVVAFESSAKAKTVHSGGGTTTTSSLESHLLIDEKYLQAICDQLQDIVEKDLAAQGFQLLPKDSVDQEPRYTGIAKTGKAGAEIGDDFMSGFAGNGLKSRWFTAGNRPFFGTGATGALSETSALIHLARESGKTLLFYRFKVQFTEIDAKNNLFISYVKGKNMLHILSADACVFTPANTMGSMMKLNANLTAGSDYVEEVRELPKDQADRVGLNMSAALSSLMGSPTTTSSSKNSGQYAIIANPDRYQADSLLLIKAVSKQVAQALRKAQK
ncbi:MAG: hypothetical protein JWM32_839 [Verrucomicrobia bacterium]|nr:hypothetical protein [Verrucomicrobiota bacterium]